MFGRETTQLCGGRTLEGTPQRMENLCISPLEFEYWWFVVNARG